MTTHTKITITIGTGLRKSGELIGCGDLREMRRLAKLCLLDNFRGYLITESDGGWRDDAGRDWVEPGILITAIVTNPSNARNAAAHLRDIFDQKCVMLEVQAVDFELI